MDNITIIDCPITKNDLCMKINISDEIIGYKSLSAGFWTNTLMISGSDFYNEQLQKLPELYKDLIWVDPETNLSWVPIMETNPNKGMVFANGTSLSDWGWASVKSIPVKESEKKKFPVPGMKGKYYSQRMDMTTLKMFGQDKFIEALEYANLLEE